MEKLWQTEIDQTDCVYIDLFASEQMFQMPDDKWENLSVYQSWKNNQYSTELRMEGNVKFRLGSSIDAMNLYNKSVCFAENGSENVILAYANRAECFFQMQMYQEALNDIELTKCANMSSRLISKLDVIEQKCHQQLAASNEMPSKCSIQLSFATNDNFPCMSNVLEIKSNKEFGRHLIANCDIPVGKTVLIEDDYVSMKCDDELVCYTCYRKKTNFIACTQCTDVVFCNTDCMDGNLTHKWECGTFFALLPYRMNFQIQTLLLAIETFLTVEHLMEFVKNVLHEEADKIPTSLHHPQSKYHFFFKLNKSAPFHSKYLSKIHQIYKNVMMLPKVSTIFNSNEKQYFLMHLILHHFLVIKTNSILSKSPWSTVSVFNVLSMLNHSCAPNLYHPRKGKQQYCVTIRPVKMGEQLFISYMPLNNELSEAERQAKFTSSWGFMCKCEKCHSIKEPINSDEITTDWNYRFLLEHYNNEGNAPHLPILLESCTTFLNKYGKSQWSTEILTIVTIFVILYIEMLV